MSTLELFLAGLFIGYLGTLALALLFLQHEQRRRKRITAEGDHLWTLAQTAITRYQNAKGHSNRDEWIIADRAIENLANAIRRWEKAAHDDPTD